MKVALVELAARDRYNIYAFIKLPRGIPLLAAILRERGHEPTCFVQTLAKVRWQDLMEYPVVGLGAITCTVNPTYEMIKRLRAEGYQGTIVMGGPHATALPEEALAAGADYVVRNEGERSFPALVEALAAGEAPDGIAGISFCRDGKVVHNPDQPFLTECELSALPFPAFDTIRGHERINHIPLNLSRGCPYRCKFCAVAGMFGERYRSPQVAARLGQLASLRKQMPEQWQRCIVFFTDDNFFGDSEGHRRTVEMLEGMIEQGLVPPHGWSCQMRVSDATPEMCALMKRAGCRIVYLGIESVDPKTLVEFNKRQTAEQVRQGLANLRAAGIEPLGMTIAGADTDTFWSLVRSGWRLKRWGVTYLQILILTPLPGTQHTAELMAAGRLGSIDYDDCNGHHVLVKPKRMSRLGVWLVANVGMFHFYYLTPHGWGLFLRYRKELTHILVAIGRQVMRRMWRLAIGWSTVR